jgi:hypothetical protein
METISLLRSKSACIEAMARDLENMFQASPPEIAAPAPQPGERVRNLLRPTRAEPPRASRRNGLKRKTGMNPKRQALWAASEKLPEPFTAEQVPSHGQTELQIRRLISNGLRGGRFSPGATRGTYRRGPKFPNLTIAAGPPATTPKERAYAQFRQEITVPRDADAV